MTDTAIQRERVNGARTDGIEVRMTGPGDRREQGALYDLCFGKTDGGTVLPWRYDRCPHGRAVATGAFDGPRGLVASYAAQPRHVRWRGEPVGRARVAQAGDVMTHPTLRSRGVFTELHWRAMGEARERGWPAAWGLPNEHSGRIYFGKLGWRLAGHIGPWTFVRENDGEARAARHLNGRLARWGTPWAAWRGRRAVELASAVARAEGLDVERWGEVPDDVAELSSHVAPRFDWMAERTAETLGWRFIEAPCGRFRALGVRDRSGALVAYAVVQRPLRPKGPRAVADALGFVVDLVGADDQAESVALGAALDLLWSQGAAAARAYAMRGSHWERRLERGGFRRPRAYKEVGAFPLIEDHPLAHATLDTSRWFFTDSDRDDEYAR